MTQDTDLAWWRNQADQMLTPIEKVKQALRANRGRLDQDYPSWKAYREAAPTEYLKHDARREYFITMQLILQYAQLNYVFIHDQLTHRDWWSKQQGGFRSTTAIQTIREHALMTKFFAVHAIAMATEDTFRAIVRSAPGTFTVAPAVEFQSVYRHVLRVISLQKFGDLLDILRLTRNTIHTNGVFFPRNGRNASLSYEERQFDFEVGKELDWLDEGFLVWMPAKLNEAMFDIVTSGAVASLPYSPRAMPEPYGGT